MSHPQLTPLKTTESIVSTFDLNNSEHLKKLETLINSLESKLSTSLVQIVKEDNKKQVNVNIGSVNINLDPDKSSSYSILEVPNSA